MRKLLPLLALISALVQPVYAQASTVDEKINSVMEPLTNAIMKVIFFEVSFGGVTVPFVLIWLLAGAIFFTFYFKFINIRGFGHALDVVRGKFDDPNDAGEVSHFQALTAALSGTVGVGNIAGVAFAGSLGGPGATFWMIVAGLLGMSSKFVECTLGTKYRRKTQTDRFQVVLCTTSEMAWPSKAKWDWGKYSRSSSPLHALEEASVGATWFRSTKRPNN